MGEKLGVFLKRIFLAVALILFPAIFVFGSAFYRCEDEILDTTSTSRIGTLERQYCRVFRYSQEQNIYPSPDMFVYRSNKYYAKFADDYIAGRVALFGKTRIGPFRDFIRVRYPDALFKETSGGWFSVDGKEKERCVMELGQYRRVEENYRYCLGKKMDRSVFDPGF